MDYRIIDLAHSADINIKNEPFPLYGHMIPEYREQQWSYSIHLFSEENCSEMCFPDEDYDFTRMIHDHVFIGAYDEGQCIGLAILAEAMFRYMYLEDLKVNQAYRRQGVGRGLIEKAMSVAKERNYHGIYTIGQDNNLDACRFYLGTGFEIGGLDTHVYRGTNQEGKADIFFYRGNIN